MEPVDGRHDLRRQRRGRERPSVPDAPRSDRRAGGRESAVVLPGPLRRCGHRRGVRVAGQSDAFRRHTARRPAQLALRPLGISGPAPQSRPLRGHVRCRAEEDRRGRPGGADLPQKTRRRCGERRRGRHRVAVGRRPDVAVAEVVAADQDGHVVGLDTSGGGGGDHRGDRADHAPGLGVVRRGDDASRIHLLQPLGDRADCGGRPGRPGVDRAVRPRGAARRAAGDRVTERHDRDRARFCGDGHRDSPGEHEQREHRDQRAEDRARGSVGHVTALGMRGGRERSGDLGACGRRRGSERAAGAVDREGVPETRGRSARV
ncbi:hypothetical protein SAMN06295885_1375 [Rathayibacter oskolensis]|uniref:Uncharacterized protein n=1 Tax=Rathayibacter oskolensis TaxID=1891671 RepID=A0A1X7NIJ2_9MICO|nr:hypothetical protein SAMN06295885_1375 [Rathayibacter oskolensis]